MESQKEYYAFISYKREDEKWAKWLQDKLEHYRFPTNLNGRTDLPKNIRPTFRDVTDLSPEPLEQAISNALLNSEWLIVVCSPRSARSPWVCKEAQTFIDLGRADHIIPFVIEGSPFSTDTATECYPDTLLKLTGSKELLAANINEMGRDAAAIKVVARMFGLKFDTLWQRYEREKRKKRFYVLGGITLLLLISFFLILFFRNQNRLLLLSQSRFVAERAEQLIAQGDSYLAQLLLLEVLPDGSFDERPFSIEAELALRKAIKSDTRKLPHSDIACYDVTLSIGDKYIVGRTQNDTAYVWRTDNGQLINKFYLKDYPNDFYDLPDKLQGINFITDTKFFFVDSIAHVWDLETGKPDQDIAIDELTLPAREANASLKCREENTSSNILDYSPSENRHIVKKKDGFLYIVGNRNAVSEKIDITYALFALFSLNSDEIFVITDNSLYTWSRSEQRICREISCAKDDYPYSSNWERKCIYFNKDMTKIVMNNIVRGGKYDLVENWVLYDLDSYQEKPIVSYSPIIFSSDGKWCVYNKADLFLENADYCILDFINNDKQTYERITTITEQATFWKWIGNNGNGVFMAYNADTLMCLDEKTLSVINKKVGFKGYLKNFSLNKNYFATIQNQKIYLYDKGANFLKSLNYNRLGELHDVELSSDCKYLLSCHETIVDTFYVDYNMKEALVYYDYYLWDIEKSSKELLKHGSFDKFIDLKFTSDGKSIVSSLGEVYDTQKKTYRHLKNSWNYAEGVCISNNGKHYAIWNGTEVALWNSYDLECQWTFNYRNPYAEIGYVEFSPNSKELLVCYRYGIYILNVETGKIIDDCAVGDGVSAFYSSDGQQIFIFASNGCFKYEFLSLTDLIKRSKNKLNGRKLTNKERTKYHLE